MSHSEHEQSRQRKPTVERLAVTSHDEALKPIWQLSYCAFRISIDKMNLSCGLYRNGVKLGVSDDQKSRRNRTEVKLSEAE